MKRNTKRRQSIRQLSALWLGAVWLSFVLLGGGLLYAVPRLNAKTQRVYAESRILHDSHRFELALVAQARGASLSQVTDDSDPQQNRVLQNRVLWLHEADDALAALQKEAETASETQLLARIAKAYAPVRSFALASSHDMAGGQVTEAQATEAQAALNRLLPLVHRHRDLNAHLMEATLRDGGRLDVLMEGWIVGLLLMATLLLLTGTWMLRAWFFAPVLNLAQAVQSLGSGDLQARAPVLRDDEMGDLCRTFNVMADALAERDRDRLYFVASVAHDLKTPLVVIGGAAQLLKQKEMRLTPEERIKWLENIARNAHKLEVMIGDLMDDVQAATGQLVLDLQPLEFSFLVREVVHEHSISAQTHLIRSDIAASCLVSGDRRRLERVLTNLISNAVKYSPAGREINVSLQTHGDHVLCCVHDEGVGIAPEDLPKLFLPFSRLERTRRMTSGTGLGLSSVKKIVEGHGGTIAVQSTLGVGTSIEFTLPLLREAKKEV